MVQITFEKASIKHQALILQWLAEPHMQEFWDNSQEHKDDILNFIHGRKQTYFYGTTKYWVGYYENQPFCFVLTDVMLPSQKMSDAHREHLSKAGTTVCLDFGIGNTKMLGKGLAAPALIQIMDFYRNNIDPHADVFFIDPNENNPRARHVYEKAGFQAVGSFNMESGFFVGEKTILLVKKII